MDAKKFAAFLKANNLYPVSDITPDPNQPRKNKPPEHIRELAVSIAHKGLDNQIHLRVECPGKFWVVNGECRTLAVSIELAAVLQEMVRNGETPCMKGWYRDENGCFYIAAVIKEYEGDEKTKAQNIYMDQLRDNEVRQNLGKLETLEAFRKATEELEIPLEEVAKGLGKSVATLSGDIIILDLPKTIRNAYDSGRCTKAVARRLAELDDENVQLRAWKKAKSEPDATKAVARIDAYMKRRNGNGQKQMFDQWGRKNPKWRKDAAKAYNRWAAAINIFDASSYANGDMRQIVETKIREIDMLELMAKAMIRQANHLTAECTAVRAERGKGLK